MNLKSFGQIWLKILELKDIHVLSKRMKTGQYGLLRTYMIGFLDVSELRRNVKLLMQLSSVMLGGKVAFMNL
jgi:hypothetical protein